MSLKNDIDTEKFDRFDDFFESREVDTKVAILTQPAPDPDALGSALALQWLLELKYGLVSDIFSESEVSHPQNQTAINVLDIRVHKKEVFVPEDYDTIVVLDTVPQNTAFSDLVKEFHVVIDHHHFEVEADVVDIRSVGSCSAIIWDYLRHFEVSYDSEKGVQVATALLFGIRNDTAGLLSENTSALDIKAHASLMDWVDRKKLQEIIHYTFPSYLYDLRSLAVANKVVKDSVLISGLGILTSKKRDALPIIADEFIRMEGVETVVVFALVGGFIESSVRSRNSSLNVHDFCQKIFGKDYAGGKQGSGGSRVPLGFLYSPLDSEDLRNDICVTAQKIITQRILSHLLG
jgi:nanoRNase/pAp phosphatase (c-di-AMP/oligoRNAs hydrolase)